MFPNRKKQEPSQEEGKVKEDKASAALPSRAHRLSDHAEAEDWFSRRLSEEIGEERQIPEEKEKKSITWPMVFSGLLVAAILIRMLMQILKI